MAQFHPAWLEYRRKYFIRPNGNLKPRANAHLSIRHDAYRFMPPGSPRYVGKDVVRYFWPDAGSQSPAQEWSEADRAELLPIKSALADLIAIRRAWAELQAIKRELAEIRFEIKFKRLLRDLKAGFNPNQPHVPAGSREGGQWTDGGGGGSGTSADGSALSGRSPASGQRTRLAQLSLPGAAATDASSPQFGPERSGWHDYRAGPNLACRAELRCSREEIADQLARFSVPGRDPSNPVQSLETSLVEDPRTGLPGGWVTTTIDDDGLSITNRTTPVHALYDGIVVRTARQTEDGSWYVTTRGFGNNVVPGMNILNQEQGPLIFNILDQRMRDNIERHRAKGIFRLAMCGVDRRGDSRSRGLLAGPYHVN
jgi:hypothetical protein